MEAMERLGSDELISIYEKLHKRHDRESFSQVSKNFLKARCISIWRFHTSCPSLLNAILPGALNLRYLHCFKPLSNEHTKLLAQSCPKLEILYLIRYSSSEENLGHAADYEFDFDNEGLCAVANACGHLYDVKLSGRLHVGDLGVVSLVRSLRNLRHLELARCVKITDESLKAIGEATCLKYVDLCDTSENLELLVILRKSMYRKHLLIVVFFCNKSYPSSGIQYFVLVKSLK
ncbi:leucine-rich repeat, cysteine-containing subtype protein [Tanacetum coccineum]